MSTQFKTIVGLLEYLVDHPSELVAFNQNPGAFFDVDPDDPDSFLYLDGVAVMLQLSSPENPDETEDWINWEKEGGEMKKIWFLRDNQVRLTMPGGRREKVMLLDHDHPERTGGECYIQPGEGLLLATDSMGYSDDPNVPEPQVGYTIHTIMVPPGSPAAGQIRSEGDAVVIGPELPVTVKDWRDESSPVVRAAYLTGFVAPVDPARPGSSAPWSVSLLLTRKIEW